MKKIILYLFCLFLIPTNLFSVCAQENYKVRSYIVIDGNENEILEGKDYHLIRSVASISKIMTAILAIESEVELFYSYTITNTMVNIEGSSLYLKEGDMYRLIDLIYGLLLRSGNDASYAISQIICESTEEFVLKMNQKAKELKMINTTFSNPCGLDVYDEGNKSTAYDMAILMKYCMQNELFREIISTKKHIFSNYVYENKNKLLKTYEYLLGGKTGYTYKAKRTLVTAAEKEEQYLIIVTLDCGNDYNFHKSRYEYYFNEFSYVVFLQKGLNYIDTYTINSDRKVGLRIEKYRIKNSIKEYFIYSKTNQLKISLILQDNTKITNNVVYDVSFS